MPLSHESKGQGGGAGSEVGKRTGIKGREFRYRRRVIRCGGGRGRSSRLVSRGTTGSHVLSSWQRGRSSVASVSSRANRRARGLSRHHVEILDRESRVVCNLLAFMGLRCEKSVQEMDIQIGEKKAVSAKQG